MKTYRVIRACTWKSQGDKRARYWEKGQIVKLNDNDNPPNHFEPVKAGDLTAEEKKAQSDFKPFSSMGLNMVPAGGMAAGMTTLAPGVPKTRGQAMKEAQAKAALESVKKNK